MYIKRLAKKGFLYINVNKIDSHQRKTTYTFLCIEKSKKSRKDYTYIHTKSETLFKMLDNLRWVLFTKKPVTLYYAIFMKFLKFAFIYFKKYDIFSSVTFLYTKSPTLRKKARQFALSFFIYKNPDTLRYAVFMEFLKLLEGGAFLYTKKCTLRYIFISKKYCTFCYVFTYNNPDTLRHIFICKKQCTLCHVFIYIIFNILYSDT